MKKKWVFFLLLLPALLFSQNSNGTITIHATSQILIPADVVDFSIRLQVEDTNPKTAFEKHKKLEKKITRRHQNIRNTRFADSLFASFDLKSKAQRAKRLFQNIPNRQIIANGSQKLLSAPVGVVE